MNLFRPLLSDVRRTLRVPADWRERLKFHAPDALAWRLLLLTFVFTVVVEILIIAPSAASFHERWLLDRLQSAELASVGVEAADAEDDVVHARGGDVVGTVAEEHGVLSAGGQGASHRPGENARPSNGLNKPRRRT